ncbi:MAG: phospholipase D-like domain-containing protein [Chloroflexi bacterium]|nr:phospholipase D-like domain-containing protein [Chloroflexota bacterium]
MGSRKSSSSGRLVVGILGTLLIVIIALLSGQDLDEFLDEFLLEDTVNEETTVSGDWYDLYFTEPINEDNWDLHTGSAVEAALIDAINGAQQSIYGALFELNMESITQALIAAQRRGVDVKLVLDDRYAIEDEESTVEELDGVVEYRADDRSALMHHKFLVIDETRVWMGSMNFTHNGIYNNNNNAVLIRSTLLAGNYLAEFREMYDDGVFTQRDDSRESPNPQLNIDETLIETFFSPEDGDALEERLEELIRESGESVHMMAFVLTLDSLGNAMIDRHNAGVDVQAVFESRGSSQGQMEPMGCAGIPVKRDGNPNTFHHKVFVFDGEIVALGSFNFSASARDDNSENMIIVHNPEFAQAFIDEFNKRFNDPEAVIPDLSC